MPESLRLAELLERRGLETMISPVMRRIELPPGPVPGRGLQAVLLTSAGALPALASAGVDPAQTICCAGEATARRVRNSGYRSVLSAAGDAADLAELVIRRLRPDAGRLLWLCGEVTRGDLQHRLEAAGYRLERRVVYRAEAMEELTEAARRALAAGEIDGVLHFSPRSARLFADLLGRAGLASATGVMIAFCLSRAVAESARELEWKAIRIAARPDRSGMLDLLPGGTHKP
ncbi:MAG: uroporphyrinogen-III synthase [Alphaproteobacteria bacterium]|nr:uroporphyrinogen-III synthase [Alphaproteobacteria bacterium]